MKIQNSNDNSSEKFVENFNDALNVKFKRLQNFDKKNHRSLNYYNFKKICNFAL